MPLLVFSPTSSVKVKQKNLWSFTQPLKNQSVAHKKTPTHIV
jgi:hypothetical protein